VLGSDYPLCDSSGVSVGHHHALTRTSLYPPPADSFLHEVSHELEHRFGIGHPTLQIEMGDGECALHSHPTI
jgi:Co/Zn/Cd efflux system component